jgi:hypothetical protein
MVQHILSPPGLGQQASIALLGLVLRSCNHSERLGEGAVAGSTVKRGIADYRKPDRSLQMFVIIADGSTSRVLK